MNIGESKDVHAVVLCILAERPTPEQSLCARAAAERLTDRATARLGAGPTSRAVREGWPEVGE